jgi:hypothetical protein
MELHQQTVVMEYRKARPANRARFVQRTHPDLRELYNAWERQADREIAHVLRRLADEPSL